MFTQDPSKNLGTGALRWALAILCFVAAPVVLFVGFIGAVMLREHMQVAILVLGLVPFVAWRLVRLGRRLKAPSGATLLQNDPRPPVLYVRSFASDEKVVTRDVSEGMARAVAQHAPWADSAVRTQRLEERNTKVLKQLGPVVTVARPSEQLAQLGAARIAFADSEWQAGVRELVKRSQLIVIESGVSAGLKWEMNEVLGQQPFKPVLLCAPPHEEESVLNRQQKYEMLKRALPEGVARVLPRDLGNTTFFFFDKPDHVIEFETEGGPPEEIVDLVRPGTIEEAANRRFRKGIMVLGVIIGALVLLMVWAGLMRSGNP